MATGIMAQTQPLERAAMSHIRILVCRVDDASADCMTELAAVDLPQVDAALTAETALDSLEATTIRVGHTVLRAALQAQWAALDAELVASYCRRIPPDQVRRDGHKVITVASRLGTLQLPRQVLTHRIGGAYVMPGDAALPTHGGIVTTRALQEWACLLAQDLPFATAARLLGWQTQEERILSPATLRTLVRRHGMLVRGAEREAITVPVHQASASQESVPLVLHATPNRRAGWPATLSSAVEAALTHEHPCPPQGITWADWARVLEAQRTDPARAAADLRFLGLAVDEHQILVAMDEVLTRAPMRREFIELRTAYIATQDGYRYVSGVGYGFLQQVRGTIGQLLAPGDALLGIADCARWIRDFFATDLATGTDKTLLLDW
jgi:hypothetical protein